jgi:predicted RND superfamily exporter protein
MSASVSGDRLLPDTRRLVTEYLFLYSLSGPDGLNGLIDPTHRIGVLRAYAKVDSAGYASELFRELATFVNVRFKDLPVQARIAGGALGVQAALNEQIVHDKIRNVVQVTIVIFLLASLALRSFAGGILVLIPLVVAVAVTMGVMGRVGTPLSFATASFTAMAIGIGADFAIYIIFRIREEVNAREGDLDTAIRTAIRTSGKAIFFVSSAVVCGYLILGFSGFRVWVYLGVLTALMIALAALGAVTVLPATIVAVRPRFICIERQVGRRDRGLGPTVEAHGDGVGEAGEMDGRRGRVAAISGRGRG